MSEVGEKPPITPEPTQPQRLEDMDEFKKLAPEQQERLLSLRERLMQEASNPREVVTRSIDEMGFWEGLRHTIKPHAQEGAKLWVKDIKAKGSLVLSLIPVLGEGVSAGKGLLGIYKAEKGWSKFEPARRIAAAGASIGPEAKAIWEAGKAYQGAKVIANDAKFGVKLGHGLGKAAEWTTRPFRVALAAGTKPFQVLNAEYATHAGKVAGKMVGENAVHAKRQAAQVLAAAEQQDYINRKLIDLKNAGNDLTNVEWWQLRKHWQKFQIQRGGAAEAKAVMRQARRDIDTLLESQIKGTGAGAIRTEAHKAVQKVKPTVLENLGLKKYLVLFDQWFNLTPDVPHWVSTTTGLAEFLGAHGIDAIPAVMQLGINAYKKFEVSKSMARDVYRYTKKRLLDKQKERKEAAAAFPVGETAPVSVAA